MRVFFLNYDLHPERSSDSKDCGDSYCGRSGRRTGSARNSGGEQSCGSPTGGQPELEKGIFLHGAVVKMLLKVLDLGQLLAHNEAQSRTYLLFIAFMMVPLKTQIETTFLVSFMLAACSSNRGDTTRSGSGQGANRSCA